MKKLSDRCINPRLVELDTYAFPPVALLNRMMKFSRLKKARMILRAPLRLNQQWFPDLLRLAMVSPSRLPNWKWLSRQPVTGSFHREPSGLGLHSGRLPTIFWVVQCFSRKVATRTSSLLRSSSTNLFQMR